MTLLSLSLDPATIGGLFTGLLILLLTLLRKKIK